MPSLSPQDQSLDQSLDLNLQSDTRLIAISIGVALAILVFATLAIIYLLPVCRSVWRTIGLPRPNRNPSAAPESKQPHYLLEPVMASTPASKLKLPRTSPYPPGIVGPPPKQQAATFFTSTASLRKHSTVSHRPTALYNGVKSFVAPTKPRPTFQARNYGRPPNAPRQPPKLSSVGEVTPHLAGWMKVADEVVGRHPNAVPLRGRIATQEEIELISGHVHIPWASTESAEHRPIVINLHRPPPAKPAYPDLPGPSTSLAKHQKRIGQLGPGPLVVAMRNARRVHNAPVTTSSISKPIPIQFDLEKSHTARRPRGKENMETVYPKAGVSTIRGPRAVAPI
ncbi:hypothetical protein CPB83DRAFT_920506 [Crepidotus variabilis]|uniref:Uncharacterized protein n=1 Tax=Crepidotus variabilis TaxID=179855 RepID=A0A9P6EJ62_9AGAR|nr:hypothetical protein CPB83DRAFT_920506 [Crepidotus variabilis]